MLRSKTNPLIVQDIVVIQAIVIAADGYYDEILLFTMGILAIVTAILLAQLITG